MRTGKPNEPPNKAKLRIDAFKSARGILNEKKVPSPNVATPKEENLQKIKKATPKKKILSKSKSTTTKKSNRSKKIK